MTRFIIALIMIGITGVAFADGHLEGETDPEMTGGTTHLLDQQKALELDPGALGAEEGDEVLEARGSASLSLPVPPQTPDTDPMPEAMRSKLEGGFLEMSCILLLYHTLSRGRRYKLLRRFARSDPERI
jgi:hypothetical protein